MAADTGDQADGAQAATTPEETDSYKITQVTFTGPSVIPDGFYSEGTANIGYITIDDQICTTIPRKRL